VLLQEPISKTQFQELSRRTYHGQFTISVDDQQPCNPRCVGKNCPRLAGPSRYCRGWNIRGHNAWQWGCPFDHPLHLRPTHGASFALDDIQPRTAKYDEIQTALQQSGPFHDGMPRLLSVRRVVNRALEEMYEKRRSFLADKHGFALEKELWHGTNCKVLPELLTHGLQPPSDTEPSDTCPVSGGKNLCTTLCGNGCKHCTKPHMWHRCHMYGYGVYLADFAQKVIVTFVNQRCNKLRRHFKSMVWVPALQGSMVQTGGRLLLMKVMFGDWQVAALQGKRMRDIGGIGAVVRQDLIPKVV